MASPSDLAGTADQLAQAIVSGKHTSVKSLLRSDVVLHCGERERITTHLIRKVGLGPDLQPGGSRPGDKTCTSTRRQIVARASRVKLCTKECAERHGATTHRQSCPDQTQSPRCVTAPNTSRAARHNGKAQWWHAGGGPVANGNAGGGARRPQGEGGKASIP